MYRQKLGKITGLVLVGLLLSFCTSISFANPDVLIHKSALVWQADGKGDAGFETISPNSSGQFQIKNAIDTKGTIQSITVSYDFTGEVRLEVSADDGKSYVPVINGVPFLVGSRESGVGSGNKLKWRAFLEPDSTLAKVKISYTDSSGVAGDFGNPELSGFKYRKSIQISGTDTALYNYQMKISIAEGSQVTTDVNCEGKIENDFEDVRFTASDGLTSLAYYLEDIAGTKPNRIATFWVKLAQLPPEGLTIYLYYGNKEAGELSKPQEVFDFYDDFNEDSLDQDKWEAEVYDNGKYDIINSALKLDAAKIISRFFQVKDGVIEYRGRSTTSNEISAIVRSKKDKELDNLSQLVYSSTFDGAQHCISVGDEVKVNDPKPLSANNYYNFRVTVNGPDIVFERYSGLGFADTFRQAQAAHKVKDGLNKGYIGLVTGGKGNGDREAYYYWIRVRKLPNPQVTVGEAGKQEQTNLAKFQNTAIAPNGDLVLKEPFAKGSYTSSVTSAKFNIRILKPRVTALLPQDTNLTLDISADKAKTYKTECHNNAFYYASLNDFKVGDSIIYKLNFSCNAKKCIGISPQVEQVALSYSPGSVFLRSPNGGEVWAATSQKEITWSASDYEPTYKMKLEYSLDGGDSYKPIIPEADNSAAYIWALPDELSTKARVRISDAHNPDIYDASDNNFSIATLQEEELYNISQTKKEAGAETEAKDGVKEEAETVIKPKDAGYEFLIQVKDREDGVGKKGGCVTFKTAGWEWSPTEKKHFAIIAIPDISYQEAQDLCATRDIKVQIKRSGGGEDEYKPKKYKFDLDSFPQDVKNKWQDENQEVEVISTEGAELK